MSATKSKTLWRRIKENVESKSISARTGKVALIVAIVFMVASATADSYQAKDIALWLNRTSTAAMLLAIIAFVIKPFINHFDGDENT